MHLPLSVGLSPFEIRYSMLRFASALGPLFALAERERIEADPSKRAAPMHGARYSETLVWDAPRLHGLYFEDQSTRPESSAPLHADDALFLKQVAAEVTSFLEGSHNDIRLQAITLAPRGTVWQRLVWEHLRAIPRGKTLSYLGLAHRLGRPKAVRAVAQAVACNPWIILNPCHRVLGSDGSLTGFAAGLARKRALLELENIRP
jgi:methylated-DNA-[protein]-cysteine S-methyltransferase